MFHSIRCYVGVWYRDSVILNIITKHDDAIKCKHDPRNWPSMKEIHRWPVTKVDDGELWCFIWSVREHMVEQTFESSVIWKAIALVVTSLFCKNPVYSSVSHSIFECIDPLLSCVRGSVVFHKRGLGCFQSYNISIHIQYTQPKWLRTSNVITFDDTGTIHCTESSQGDHQK